MASAGQAPRSQQQIQLTTYSPPSGQRSKGSLRFNVHSDDTDVTFDTPESEGEFNRNIGEATDFGLSFVDLTNDNDKSSFVIMIHLYNNGPNIPVQGNKGRFIGIAGQPIATYQLTLGEILEGNQPILLKRLAGDIIKDLTNAKTHLSVNGAKETLRKFMKSIFTGNILNETLDALLSEFKNESTPSSGETIIPGVLSHKNHNFKIPEDEARRCPKMWSRDSGPAPTEILPPGGIPIRTSEINNVDTIKNKLNGSNQGDNTKQLQYTAGNKIDPATNSTDPAFYSPLFINYYPSFLSRFNGVEPQQLAFGLFTRRGLSNGDIVYHKGFILDVEIINQNGILNKQVIAEFNNVYCDMTQSKIFGSVGRDTNHKYTRLDKNPVVYNNNTSPKEFKKAISGNNEKNAFFLKFMNKTITDTKEAEGLAKIILKSGGDPNQLLFIIAEILYYSLLIYKEDQLGQQTQKSLKQIFQETYKNYLLVTCDGVLAGLARRLKIAHVHQIGNSANYVKYETTSDEEKALSTFTSLKEKLKRDLENYMKLLSRCNVWNLYIIFGDNAILPLPVTSKDGGRIPWYNMNENIKLLKIAIQKHFTEIEDLTQQNTDELKRILDLHKSSIITKTTKITDGGVKMTIYHLNYLQSLSLLLWLGIDMTDFVFCTKLTNTGDIAKAHPDYKGCIASYNLLQAQAASAAEEKSAESGAAAAPAPAAENYSLFEESVCSDQIICDFLKGTKTERRDDGKNTQSASQSASQPASLSQSASQPASLSQSASASASQSISRSIQISSLLPAKIKHKLSATKTNEAIKQVYNTRSAAAAARRSLAIIDTVVRHSNSVGRLRRRVGGGKSNNGIFQKGGCEHPRDDEFFNMENLFGLLGDKAICEWINVIENPRNNNKIYIDCSHIIRTDDESGNTSHSGGPDNKILSVKLPDVQYRTLALLADDMFIQYRDEFIAFISRENQTPTITILTLYDIVQDFILTLKRKEREREITRAAAAQAQVEATQAPVEAAQAPVEAEARAVAEEAAGEARAAEARAAAEAEARAAAAKVDAAEAKVDAAEVDAVEEEEAQAAQAAMRLVEEVAGIAENISIEEQTNKTSQSIEIFLQNQLEHHDVLYSLCELFNSVDHDEDDTDIPVAEPYTKSEERLDDIIYRGDGGDGGGGGGGGGCIKPKLSLERAGEVFSCLCSVARQFEAAALPLEADRPSQSILSRLLDLENTTTVRNGGDNNCISTLKNKIGELIPITCKDILDKVGVMREEATAAASAKAAARTAESAKAEAAAAEAAEEEAQKTKNDTRSNANNLDDKMKIHLRKQEEWGAVVEANDKIGSKRNPNPINKGLAMINSSVRQGKAQAARPDLDRASSAAAAAEAAAEAAADAAHTAKVKAEAADTAKAEAVEAAAKAEAAETAAAKAEEAVTSKSSSQFKQAATALHALPLEFHTESSEYVKFLCTCNEALIDFMYEADIIKKIEEAAAAATGAATATATATGAAADYRYICATAIENCEGSVAPGVDGSTVADPLKSRDDTLRPHYTPTHTHTVADESESQLSVGLGQHRPIIMDPTLTPSTSPTPSQSLPESLPASQQPTSPSHLSDIKPETLEYSFDSVGGRRPTPKKSTHRKPRRHTRNYQSHNNKRKQHSSKKSTIKHHKSYRKHNRTIKRRSHRK